jgi:succinoglycan biosynthesis transport protein ExoP
MWKNNAVARSDDDPTEPEWRRNTSDVPTEPPIGRRSEQLDLEDLLGIKDKGPTLTLTDIWYLFRERWWWGALVGLLLASCAAVLIMRQPKQYQSFARIEITEDRDVFVVEAVLSADADDRVIDAHVIKMASRDFMEFLATTIDPTKNEKEADEALELLVANGLTAADLQDLADSFGTARGEGFRSRLADQLSSSVTTGRVKGKQVVTIFARHGDPESAAQVANLAGDAYKRFDLNAKAAALSKKETSLQEAVDEAHKGFSKAHDDLFKLSQTREVPLDGQPDWLRREVDTLTTEINVMEAELTSNSAALENIRAETDLSKLFALPVIKVDERVGVAWQTFEKAEAEVIKLRNSGLGTRHPDMVAANEDILFSRGVLQRAISNATDVLAEEVRRDAIELARKQARFNKRNKEIAGKSEHDGEFAKFEAEITRKELKLKNLEQSLADVRLTKTAEMSNIELFEHAKPNYIEVSPDRKVAMLTSLGIFGLCLVGIPITVGLLDTRLKSISEIEKFLGVECLATVPTKKGDDANDLGLAVMTGSDEAVVESFRVLYSSLRMASSNEYPLAMLVTSSAPSEGKSFITTNLAAFFAEQGKRALIIDCDFRKPTQHRNVKEVNDQGIIRWYHSDESVPQDPDQFGESKTLGFLALGESENLFLLRAGGTSKSPTAMIESLRFAQLVHALKAYFDVVIFDTPPVGLFPDALFVSDYTHEAVFVTKFRELHRHKVKFALSQLHKAGCSVLGVVVNYLTSQGGGGYGYGYSDYGYGHYTSKDYAKYYNSSDD